jgi:hypothetical protein
LVNALIVKLYTPPAKAGSYVLANALLVQRLKERLDTDRAKGCSVLRDKGQLRSFDNINIHLAEEVSVIDRPGPSRVPAREFREEFLENRQQREAAF